MAKPEAELFVHCTGGLNEEELAWLSARMEPVLDEVIQKHPGSELEELAELELSLVDDATLAEVHGDFLG